jgi:uncharacterized protein YbgA (DUF1722 family)
MNGALPLAIRKEYVRLFPAAYLCLSHKFVEYYTKVAPPVF